MSGKLQWIFSLLATFLALCFCALAQQPGPAFHTTDLWAQLAKIDGILGGQYQPTVAVSGDTVVVGAGFGNDGSAAYVFVKPTDGWTNMKLVARLKYSGGPLTGSDVAIDGDTVMVGDCCSITGGAVYVFVKPSGGWTDTAQIAILTPSDPVSNNYFGNVSLSGNTAVIGAYGLNTDTGAAYVFVKPASGWTNMTQTAKLTASDGAAYDEFGSSVAIDGNTIAIGAPGALSWQGKGYVFVEPADGWKDGTQTAELTASDGQPYNVLGVSIAVSGDTVATGAPGTYGGSAQGAAYVFVQPTGGWINMTQTGKLTPANIGSCGYNLGWSVGVTNNLVVAGAPFDCMNFNVSGSIFIFDRPLNGWKDESSNVKMFGGEARGNGEVGYSLAISGRVLVTTALTTVGFQTHRAATVYVFAVLSEGAPDARPEL
jgi:hypothetical protein